MSAWFRYVIPLVILMVALVSVPIHAQAPQYITCTEVVPGVPGSGLSHVIVWLRLSNVTTSNGLLYLLDQMYYNPSSPYFHEFITPQEFASWYSPPGYVFTYIENLAAQYGLIVNYTFPMLIEATGNASSVDNFLTALQSAPADISQWILAGECIPIGYSFPVIGQHKVQQYSPMIVKGTLPPGVTPQYVLQHAVRINGKPAYFIIAQQMYPSEVWLPFGLEFIYDELPLLQSGYNGSGYTIAIVDAFGDFNFTLASQYVYQSVACNDLYTFDQLFGLPNPPSCQVIYPTGVPILTQYNLYLAKGWAGESALDIEYAHTMAPGANITLVVSPDQGDDLFVDVEYVVNNSLANFISLSWGLPEDLYFISPYVYDEIFMQAAAEGIGVFVASGDHGAFDVFIIPIEPSVSYPASDPWVTAVGGTTLYAYITPTGQVIRNEYAWNWGPYQSPYPKWWGSGGGYSFTFPETPGQALVHIVYERTYVYEPDLGINFYTVGYRGVPDIAADANSYTGVQIVLNGMLVSPFGGTSLAAPLSAGMTATIQSYLGKSFIIGDLAPTLYLLYYYYPSYFYVTQSTLPVQSYFTGIPNFMFENYGGQSGVYYVIPGQWNPVTGLGQINVYGLAQALNGLANR
jgi:subtilase family serine protease